MKVERMSLLSIKEEGSMSISFMTKDGGAGAMSAPAVSNAESKIPATLRQDLYVSVAEEKLTVRTRHRNTGPRRDANTSRYYLDIRTHHLKSVELRKNTRNRHVRWLGATPNDNTEERGYSIVSRGCQLTRLSGKTSAHQHCSSVAQP